MSSAHLPLLTADQLRVACAKYKELSDAYFTQFPHPPDRVDPQIAAALLTADVHARAIDFARGTVLVAASPEAVQR